MLDSDQWFAVPDGSTFTIKLSDTQGACQATGELAVDGSVVDRWPTSDLVAGKSLTVRSPHRYSLDLTLLFLGAATQTVEVKVTDPGGNVYGSPYSESVWPEGRCRVGPLRCHQCALI